MPLFKSQQQSDRSSGWLGIAAIVVIEILVLLALAFAVVRYVEWSSEAAQAEFMRAPNSTASDLNSSERSSIQPMKAQAACPRKG
jgi:hypothetical protein